MNDYEQRRHEWALRSAQAVRDLAASYVELQAETAATGGGGMDPTGVRAPSDHAAAPVRIDVLDLIADIARLATRYAPLCRGTLRMGDVAPHAGTTSALRFVADVLPRLDVEDPSLTEEVAGQAWSLSRRAAGILDTPPPRAFRSAGTCPTCGEASVWVDPRSWRVACGMPDCGTSWAIELSQPVGTTGP